jgi:hypothetical protein
MNPNPTAAQTGAAPPAPAWVRPGERPPPEATVTLAQLKSRLLRETLAAGPGEPLASFLRLAATEAEAQAWLSSFPLLTFPVLFEEKAREVRTYFARQERLRWKPG